MKQLTVILLTLGLLALSACGGSNSPNPASSNAPLEVISGIAPPARINGIQ